MFDFQDLFQWERFITPTIIKTFYFGRFLVPDAVQRHKRVHARL